jgi:hypothetical protein
MNEAVTQTDLIAELHQLRTQLERAMVNAERYDKLRAWMIKHGHYEKCDQESFYNGLAGRTLYGPTFEQAVDALPEPEEK